MLQMVLAVDGDIPQMVISFLVPSVSLSLTIKFNLGQSCYDHSHDMLVGMLDDNALLITSSVPFS